MSSDQKNKVANNCFAHYEALLINFYLYTKGVCSNVNTFIILYCLKLDQISLLHKSKHNISLISLGDFGYWFKLR